MGPAVVVPRRFRLRWAFYYHNGRPPRIGIWDGAGNGVRDMAAFQPKDGLLWAAIEAESIFDFTIKRLVEVSGPDLQTIEWDTFVRGPGVSWKGGSYQPACRLAGLSLITRTERISAKIDGSLTRKVLSAEERCVNVFEHRL